MTHDLPPRHSSSVDDEALPQPEQTAAIAATEEPGSSVRRPRRRLLVVAAVALPVLFIVGVVLARRPPAPALRAPGHGAAKSFTLPNIRDGGPPVSLAAYRGKPVVVNLFASWCVPCRRELSAFQAVSQKVRGRVAFVGINHQDSRRLGLALLRETGVTYPAGYDPDGKVALRYGLFGMPTTLFVSADGRLLERRTGEMSRKELEQTIDRLFAPPPRRPTSDQGLRQ